MEQQLTEETKLKLSRSAARHLRRKKLNAAKRETENWSQSSSSQPTVTGRAKNQQQFESKQELHRSTEKPSTESLDSKFDPKLESVKIKVESKDVLDLKINEIQTNKETTRCQNKLLNSELHTDSPVTATVTVVTSPQSSSSTNSINRSKLKMNSEEKSREQVKAEREAKKLAKALAKGKGKTKNEESLDQPDDAGHRRAEGKTSIVKVNNVDEKNTSNSASQSAKKTVFQNVGVEDKKETIESSKGEEEKKPEKSKKELREERRKIQEAQRAAKAALPEKKKAAKPVTEKKDEKSVTPVKKEATAKKVGIKTEGKENLHEVNLFKHLYINRNNISQLINSSNVNIHPAIIKLGVQYAEKVIVGSNARCVALLAAVKQLINDFERPLQADFTRGLEASLLQAKNYLDFCRPSSVSMENALKHIKRQMSTLPSTIHDKEAKLKLTNAIDTYILEQIDLADKAISQAIQKKIVNGDVILTYGFSSLIYKILCDAYDAKKQFRVIVVDGRPWLEGKEQLRRLVKYGIDCSYMLVNALSFIMPQVNKVFLGAHAILANGAVMSRVGTAQVALMANAFNVPVLVACETHKSCERVQTDSIVFNEIGDPDELVKNTFCSKKSCLSNWKSKKMLNLLNITYDVTPADLVTAVVTELAILPCTSVPVILRIKPSKMEKS